MKTRNDIYELIEQLNVTMDTLEREYNVDQGGCFLTTWVIAKNLYERKIDYRVVVYAYPESTTRDVRTLVRNEQICHMCIQTYKMEIGGVDDDLVNEHGLKKIITNLRFEKGVTNIQVSLKDNTITITFDPQKTSTEELIAAFKKIGFTAFLCNPEAPVPCPEPVCPAEVAPCGEPVCPVEGAPCCN